MSTTISGRFDSDEDARRGAAWLEREGIPRDAIVIAEGAASADGQPDGPRGAADRTGAGRHWTVTVRTGDAAHRRLAMDVLRTAGARDLDRPAHAQRSGVDAAGSAFGMAIADAATAPMSGVSASRAAQEPAEGERKPSGKERSGKPGAAGGESPPVSRR
jgi:hypothetical protein